MYGFSRLTGALGGIGAARVAVRERWRAVVEIAGPPRIYRIADEYRTFGIILNILNIDVKHSD